MKKIEKKQINYKLLFYVSFILIFIFLLWKCKYGSGKRDEALYLILVNRLSQGDALIVDEQHLCQLFSFLTYPFFFLYKLLFKDLSSVVITFRYLYVIIQSLTAFFIYKKLKQINELGAMLSSVFFMLYSPLNLMALNYNTICIMALTISLLIFITDSKKYEYVICGLLFAVAVLCNPYLAIIYFIYTVLVIFQKNDGFLNRTKWFFITIGVITLAIIFILFILSRASLSEIIYSIQFVFDDIGYHIDSNIFVKAFHYAKYILMESPITMILHCILFIGTLMFAFDKKKDKNKIRYLLFTSIISVIYLLYLGITSKQISLIVWPMNFVGLFIIVANCKNANNNGLLVYLFVAYIYTFFISFSSDTGMEAVSSASIVALVINIFVMCCEIGTNKNEKKKKENVILIVTLTIFLFCMLFYKTIFVYNKQAIYIQNKTIENGPYKSIVVNDDFYNTLNKEAEEVQYIRKNLCGDSILVLDDNTWIYLLANDYKVSSTSAWKTRKQYKNVCIDSLNTYYLTHKMPDIIYVDDEFKENVVFLKNINKYKSVELEGTTLYYLSSKANK